ncbi:HlyD family efflux transporter periplasmic adaptor subunit [Marinobacterium aestuariivivens]|uniref:HlyD family efflux transporter periplasmic adaptor subunit n=1 Tax=Marinobacterium aestuariivivens TaxID=1698799 RepID=A0ABW2A6P0_9GAMM
MNDAESRALHEALRDHSAEGIGILTAEPSRLIGFILYLLAALMLAALAWSFVGRADVIVKAPGVLGPESRVRRVYAPIEGELVDLYIAEGTPVAEGDVLARINARGAIQAATAALQAELALAEAERAYNLFPARKALLQSKADSLQQKLELEQQLHRQRVTEGLGKLSEAHKASLERARAGLEQSRTLMNAARGEMSAFERLYNSPGGGGVSRNQVQEKRNAYAVARSNTIAAEAALSELELQLSSQQREKSREIERSAQQLRELRIQYEEALEAVRQAEDRVMTDLRAARLNAEGAARIRFDNIDEDNFLRILAPSDGVITRINFSQPGDKVSADRPLATLAPADAATVLHVEIPERDRGFLREGLPVKLKFNAFPFQRYGFIDGSLEYISPGTVVSEQSGQPVYQGRVSLARDYFSDSGQQHALRFGMQAEAEIQVRKRRLIDLALDPFRRLQQ